MELGSHVAKCILNAFNFTSSPSKDNLSHVYLWTTEQKSGCRLNIAGTDGFKLVCFSPDIDENWLKNNPVNGVLDLSDIKIPTNMVVSSLKFKDSKLFILSLNKRGSSTTFNFELKPFQKNMPNFKEVIESATSENVFNGRVFQAESYIDPEETLNYIDVFKSGKEYLIGILSDPAEFGRVLDYKVTKSIKGKDISGDIDINFKINCFYKNSNSHFSNQKDRIYVNLDFYRQALNQIIKVCGGKVNQSYTTIKIKKNVDLVIIETLSQKVSQLNIIMPVSNPKEV